MRSSVFPDPAGACTRNEREGSSARARAAASGSIVSAGSSASNASISCRSPIVVLAVHRTRADAAQRLQTESQRWAKVAERINLQLD